MASSDLHARASFTPIHSGFPLPRRKVLQPLYSFMMLMPEPWGQRCHVLMPARDETWPLLELHLYKPCFIVSFCCICFSYHKLSLAGWSLALRSPSFYFACVRPLSLISFNTSFGSSLKFVDALFLFKLYILYFSLPRLGFFTVDLRKSGDYRQG